MTTSAGGTPVSDTFSVLNDKLLMFHALYTMQDCIHELPDLDCIVFCRRTDDGLHLFDIVAERIPPLAEITPYFAPRATPAVAEDVAERTPGTVEIHFHPDKLEAAATSTRALRGNNPFVRGAFPFDQPIFPYTSRA